MHIDELLEKKIHVPRAGMDYLIIRKTHDEKDYQPYYILDDNGRYYANVYKTDSKKIYWYKYVFGKRISGAIPFETIKVLEYGNKTRYILVDPNNDSGNDDGILDQMELTEKQADDLNNKRRENRNDCRWVKERNNKL